jgi:hypothetical protein
MKKEALGFLVLLTSLITLTSCNKNDDPDTKTPFLQSYGVEEREDSDVFKVDGVFHYGEGNLITSSELYFSDYEDDKKDGGVDIDTVNFSFVYDDNKLVQLIMREEYRSDYFELTYKYKYEDNRLTGVDIIETSGNLEAKLSPKSHFSLGKTNYHNIESIALDYTGDKLKGMSVLDSNGNLLYEYEVTWSGNNISKVVSYRYDGYHRKTSSVKTIKYTYDNSPNLVKGAALSGYITPLLSEVMYDSDQFGIISYFSENNLTKIIYDYEDDFYEVNIDLGYEKEIVTSAKFTIKGEDHYSMTSKLNIDWK